jgi:hypothetical protein
MSGNNDMSDYRVSLKEFILRIMDERDKSVDQRLSKLNELREEVTSDRDQFLKVDTYEADKKAITDKIDYLQKLLFIGIGIVLILELLFRIGKI